MKKDKKMALILTILRTGHELSVAYAEEIFAEIIDYLKNQPLRPEIRSSGEEEGEQSDDEHDDGV